MHNTYNNTQNVQLHINTTSTNHHRYTQSHTATHTHTHSIIIHCHHKHKHPGLFFVNFHCACMHPNFMWQSRRSFCPLTNQCSDEAKEAEQQTRAAWISSNSCRELHSEKAECGQQENGSQMPTF